MKIRQSACWLVLTSIFFVVGCGGDAGPDIEVPSNLAPVSGVVKLDGQPLAGALVVFAPTDGAESPRSSRAVTDDNGKYELNWLPTVKGAVPGNHTVSISKQGSDETEVLPPLYNAKTTLKAEVKEGENDIPFDLKK